MALEKYRVMGVMAALESFTATELADASGVHIDTVRTQITRLRDFFTAEPIPNQKPGARMLRYRLAKHKRAAFIAELRDFYQFLRVDDKPNDADREELAARFDALEALKHRLRDRAASTQERERLQRIASHHFTSIHEAVAHLADDDDAKALRERYDALRQEMNRLVVYLTVAQAPRLADFVKKTLDAEEATVIIDPKAMYRAEVLGAHEIAVVTVDSREANGAFAGFLRAREAAAEHPLVVVDEAFSQKLQNAALSTHALYFGGGKDLDRNALIGVIDMAAQVSRANDLDDTTTRRKRVSRKRPEAGQTGRE